MKSEPRSAQTLRDLTISIPEPDISWPRVAASDSIRSAARVFSETGAAGILVYEGDEFLGAVSPQSLLGELWRDEDSVTGLPRAGALRDWLRDQLKAGREVAVVFLDMDRFSQINAEKGHTEGDAALERIASALLAFCAETDFCARYGGDEFAIGTLRPRHDAENLAHEASCALVAIGLPATFGVSGGRRLAKRPDAHLGSMVEELLRLASLACMSNKNRRL